MHVDIAIIGAGPCGLGAAWELERARGAQARDRSYVVIDRSMSAGGSAASVVASGGFVFDYGGHVLYPHEDYTDFVALLDSLIPDWHASIPVRGVWIDECLIPYPVQRNIHRLPPWKMLLSLAGLCTKMLLRAPAHGERDSLGERNLYDHLLDRFGFGLTRLVMAPLNRKMWAYEPRSLSSDWTGQRSGSATPNVAGADVGVIMRSILTGQDNPGWTQTTRVRYPRHGGSGSIWAGLAARLPADRFRLGRNVAAIDARAKTLELDGGERVSYDWLLSTIPLDLMLGLFVDEPDLARLAPALRYSQAYFVGFGIAGDPPEFLSGVHSSHTPDRDIPCWRVSFPASFSPENVPAGHWSVLCEISRPLGETYDVASAAAKIEASFRRSGIIAPTARIVSRWHDHLAHGYPTPFLGRDAVLQEIQARLLSKHVVSRGRFGGWKYEVSNQDHSFMQGVEAIAHVVDGTVERTYRFPKAVNNAAGSAGHAVR